MAFAAILAGQDSPQRRAVPPSVVSAPLPHLAASVNSASCLCDLCVSTSSLNSHRLTANQHALPQEPCFQNLPHSWITTRHITPLFSETYKLLRRVTTLFSHPYAKHRGCAPIPAAISEPILELEQLTSSVRAVCPTRRRYKSERHLLDPSANARLQCVVLV
jgi:hypothetical protein